VSSEEHFPEDAANQSPADDERLEETAQAEPTADVPDPNGPPVPVQSGPVMSLTTTVMSIAVAGGVVLMLISASTSSTMGATKSSQLEWQQRQAEIEQAAEELESYKREADTPDIE